MKRSNSYIELEQKIAKTKKRLKQLDAVVASLQATLSRDKEALVKKRLTRVKFPILLKYMANGFNWTNEGCIGTKYKNMCILSTLYDNNLYACKMEEDEDDVAYFDDADYFSFNVPDILGKVILCSKCHACLYSDGGFIEAFRDWAIDATGYIEKEDWTELTSLVDTENMTRIF